MTEIPLGFADSRIYEEDGEICYDMWPAAGTQMIVPLRGVVSNKKVIRNTDNELVLRKGICRHKFRFSPDIAGLVGLKYSVSLFGIIPLGSHWGEVSSDGKRALRAAYENRD